MSLIDTTELDELIRGSMIFEKLTFGRRVARHYVTEVVCAAVLDNFPDNLFRHVPSRVFGEQL